MFFYIHLLFLLQCCGSLSLPLIMMQIKATAKVNFFEFSITNPTPDRRVTPPWNVYIAKFDPGWEGYPVWQTGLPAYRLGGSPHLSCKRVQIKMSDYMDRQVTPPKQATSPTWGPAPTCKQALKVRMKRTSSVPKSPSGNWRYESLLVQSHWYENDFLFSYK